MNLIRVHIFIESQKDKEKNVGFYEDHRPMNLVQIHIYASWKTNQLE